MFHPHPTAAFTINENADPKYGADILNASSRSLPSTASSPRGDPRPIKSSSSYRCVVFVEAVQLMLRDWLPFLATRAPAPNVMVGFRGAAR